MRAMAHMRAVRRIIIYVRQAIRDDKIVSAYAARNLVEYFA